MCPTCFGLYFQKRRYCTQSSLYGNNVPHVLDYASREDDTAHNLAFKVTASHSFSIILPKKTKSLSHNNNLSFLDRVEGLNKNIFAITITILNIIHRPTLSIKHDVLEKNAVFWDFTPCGSFKSQRFGGTYRLHLQGEKNRRARNVSSNNRNTLRRNAMS
jgi:hypothetical protein